MKNKYLLIILFSVFFSCKNVQEKYGDNQELIKMYEEDQYDRSNESPVFWKLKVKSDSMHLARVRKMLDLGLVRTSNDYVNAAMIFQHGPFAEDHRMAIEMMKKAIELNPATNKSLLAAATDRYLISTGKPQIYGTQYTILDDGSWQLDTIDTTKITDAERREYGVETLEEQQEKVKIKSRINFASLNISENSVDEFITAIKKDEVNKTLSDVSEPSINNFGYELMERGKNEDALKIFKLNIELFPNSFNVYDSYGECLLKLGMKKEAINTLKKSISINRSNVHAKSILFDIEECRILLHRKEFRGLVLKRAG